MQITLSHHATTSSFKIGKRGDALTRRVSRLNSANLVAGLLGISFGQLHQYWAQVTKQPSGAMIRPGGEVDLCGRCGGGIAIGRDDISGTECPNAVDGKRLPACILEQSIKFGCYSLKGHTIRCAPLCILNEW